MKLSENTLEVLKNASSLNTGIYFKSGNTVRSINSGKTVLLEAVIDETIPKDFGVYNLHQLLAIISLHEAPPEITFNNNDLVVRSEDGRSKITYRSCEENMIKVPPEQNIALPSEDVSFLLTESDYKWVMKTAGVLLCPNISVVSSDGKLFLRVFDASDDSSINNWLEIGPHTGTPVDVLFKTDNWKMIPGTYAVSICTQGAAEFVNQARNIKYWLAIETKQK